MVEAVATFCPVEIPVNASDIEIDVGTVESYKYAQEISYKKA